MDNDKLQQSLKEVDAELAALSKEVRPVHDLWPAIEAEIRPRRLFGWHSFGLAASACLAVIVGSWLWFDDSRTNTAKPSLMAGITAQDTKVNRLAPIEIQRPRAQLAFYPGDKYLAARDQALNELEQRLASLSPAERSIIAGNLVAIETALQEIDAALSENPDNTLLKELLLNTYQRELSAIMTMNRITDSRRKSL